MVSHLFFSQLVLVALVWLCVMLHWAWPSDPAAVCPTTPEPPCPRPQHHREPTPFAGLTRTAPSRLGARHPASCPRGDGRARWIPRSTSAPMPPAPIGAG